MSTETARIAIAYHSGKGHTARQAEAVAAGAAAVPGAVADLVALDATSLTFLVISTLAATLVGRLRSIPITFGAAIVIGLILGELIKRVTIGLLIGLGIGLLVASLISNRRK